jgi:transcriptional regulator with XRE-family HTH domain
MIVGERLRKIREQKNLSQGDLERKSGLIRSYISRVENGHTVPSLGTLEKLARALDVPLYRFFQDGEEPPKLLSLPKREEGIAEGWGASGPAALFWRRFRALLGRIEEGDRSVLFFVAQKLARRRQEPL